ncbi:MAG: fused MFS/spermidine synthase [Rhodospirillales bacterium]|nr:fused MFS/spermidine synthase [Rhodospirillales bacterium]
MTPFFGVSLFIWAGILSITLVFLAVGYQLGGKISARAKPADVEFLFLAAPIASAMGIVLATLIYPLLFPWLAQGYLILGSFVGATVLLALPLITLSAMNPLLISLLRAKKNAGDSGAGRVFYVSTMGSVAGVLLTAFAIIPNITNFRGALVLGLGLSAVVLAFIWTAGGLSRQRRHRLLALALVSGLLCVTVSVLKEAYLGVINRVTETGSSHKIVAEYTSMFGNIKVVEVRRSGAAGATERFFIQDGLVQNRTGLDNSSLSAYTEMLEKMVHLHAPEARDVLVLGLGAGIVPRNLAAQGKRVTVVEINETALQAAVEHFGFRPDLAQVRIEDARTYVRTCRQDYDVAVVDLFLGDNVPDYLMTMEFFGDVRACLRPAGALVMNVFFDSENPEPNGRLLATIARSFPNLYLAGATAGNVYIAASARAGAPKQAQPTGGMITSLASFSLPLGYQLPRRLYAGYEPISDAHNIFSLLFSDANLTLRQYLVGELPAHVLVN